MEKLGIPTITVTTSEFLSLSKASALGQGVADPCLVVVPHPMGMIPLPEIRKKAEGIFPDLLKAATQWKPTAQLPPLKPSYPAERIEFKGTVEEVNRVAFGKGWSMGLPIIPPTPERVVAMLKGTSRKPDEVIGIVPPRMGVLTVEMVAVHAAMAGCRPQYMPVLISALEALLDPETNWQGASTTTGTTAMLVIVNGPIVKEIGLACAQGSAGKGHHANAAIGYAMNSIAYAVGGSRPPSPDKSTLAAPSDFTGWIFGENEDALPQGWNPYHVQRGFQKSESVVTVQGIYPPVENIDHWSSSMEEHINWWGHLVNGMNNIGGPCSPQTLLMPRVVGVGPEHAQTAATAGWTQDRFKKAFWEATRIPVSAWPRVSGRFKALEELLKINITPDTLIPMATRPEDIYLVIAGGAGKQSHYFPPFPGCFPASRRIKK